jgi:Anti-sigma-K factor rskA, C-terminal/Sigma-70, region 4
MATFDQLTEEQRAILELLLRRGQSYADLSGKLDLPEGRVRELARDALVELAPVTARGVDSDWRGQLSDYVLGQQAGPESTATRGHLRRSEAARSWARSLLDSLDGLYGDGVPAIPDAERGGAKAPKRTREREPAPVKEKKAPREPLSAEAGEAVRRRRLMAAGGVLALLILVGVLLWPIGVLTGGSSDSKDKPAASGKTAVNKNVQGQAVIAQQGGKNQILVSAVGLKPSTQKEAYQVWLYNSQSDSKSLGFAAANAKGQLQGGATLPSNYQRFKFIDISREPVDRNGAHSGDSVMRGALTLLKKPIAQGSGKNRATVVASIRLQPLPQ